MLDQKAEVQPPKGKPALFGATPLFFAAWSGDTAAVEALRARGAAGNPKMIVGGLDSTSVLSMAAQDGDLEMAGSLKRTGVPVDDEDIDTGLTALDWAVFKNDGKLACFLINQGANVNHRDKLGYTPLHWAANVDFGESSMVRLLLRAGADGSARTDEGLTPLQLASRHKYMLHQKTLKPVAQKKAYSP